MEDWAVDYVKPKLEALASMLNAFSKDYYYHASTVPQYELVRTKRNDHGKGGMLFMMTRSLESELKQAKTPNDLLMLYKRIKRREYDD